MAIANQNYTGPFDAEVDVVVVGAGGAGLSSAIAAADNGADTLLLEKRPSPYDCTTALSSGAVSFAGTDLQKKRGIKDSNDALYKDIMETGRWKNEPKLVQAYVDNQLETFNWLTKLGIKWGSIEGLAGMSNPRAHLVYPVHLIETLTRAAKEKGVKILYKASMIGLLTEDNSKVIGVKVSEASGTVFIRARKGVVLTCGGFARDKERLAKLDPRYVKMCTFAGGMGCTGDGHRMAKELGAYERDIEYVKPSFAAHVSASSVSETSLLYYYGAIVVNKRGERFMNESISYRDMGLISLDQPDGVGYQVFDQRIFDAAVMKTKEQEGIISPEVVVEGLDKARISLLDSGDTVEELADRIHVSVGALKRTVERYNGFVDSGKDLDFGRKTLVGNIGKPMRIDKPKFYAFATMNHWTSTYGGIAIDENMRVLRTGGTIPGLYAAGEIVGGFHGASYHTGTSVGKALVFGRVAGRNVALGH